MYKQNNFVWLTLAQQDNAIFIGPLFLLQCWLFLSTVFNLRDNLKNKQTNKQKVLVANNSTNRNQFDYKIEKTRIESKFEAMPNTGPMNNGNKNGNAKKNPVMQQNFNSLNDILSMSTK